MANTQQTPRKRPPEPIGPTTIPGEPLDPKIPPEQAPGQDANRHGENAPDRPDRDEELERRKRP